MRFSGSLFGGIPPVVKNLLILNALMLLVTWVIGNSMEYNLSTSLGLYRFDSSHFRPYQLVTHMFMHGDFFHLLFNMYALWMFGKVIETVWGGKKFLIYYLVTGLGAATLHNLVSWFEVSSLINSAQQVLNAPTPDGFLLFIKTYVPDAYKSTIDFTTNWSTASDPTTYVNEATAFVHKVVEKLSDIPTVGASGAIYGVLLAFGMLFPNVPLMLLFFPVPIKAKYFVIGFGLIELFYGLQNSPGDNVAHFAHLGGMVFGFILIKIWAKTNPPAGRFF